MTALAEFPLFSAGSIPIPTEKGPTLADTAMRCKLSISCWDGYRFDRQVSEEIADLHNADKDAGRYRKRLLPRDALKEITQIVGLARRQHAFYTLPWGDDEYRILSSAAYPDHLREMREFQHAFEAAALRFEGRYEPLVIHHSGLGTMFKIEDYPGMRAEGGAPRFLYPNELRARFSFKTDILPMTDAEDFRAAVGDEERQRIRRQIADSVKAALRLGTREIWQRLFEPVSHMSKCLKEFNGADKDNKPKLYDSMISNIVRVLDVLPKLNLEGDAALERMGEEIRRELIVERKELKKSEELASVTASKAEEITRRMAAYMGMPAATSQGAS